jgi:hypothetical protein
MIEQSITVILTVFQLRSVAATNEQDADCGQKVFADTPCLAWSVTRSTPYIKKLEPT